MTLHRFVGLPGVKGGTLYGPLAGSVTAMSKVLVKHRICASAGSSGCVQVFINDEGEYHCEFQQYQQTVDRVIVRSNSMMVAWLKEWFPKCSS